uniref:p17 protein n=1 Tax=Avian orthoreovirus TaxID=38170 RepID=A3E8L2_9REOV|nr:p17 protein [Avian orthoreovirus]
MQPLRRTVFNVERFELSPIVFREWASPSFVAVTASDPVKYFNIELKSTHPLCSSICDLLSRPCEVHVSLVRRFALFSTLSSICEYDCALFGLSDAIYRLPSGSRTSRLVVHWDGRSNSITAKRSRGTDTLLDFEREYKLWRFGSDTRTVG